MKEIINLIKEKKNEEFKNIFEANLDYTKVDLYLCYCSKFNSFEILEYLLNKKEISLTSNYNILIRLAYSHDNIEVFKKILYFKKEPIDQELLTDIISQKKSDFFIFLLEEEHVNYNLFIRNISFTEKILDNKNIDMIKFLLNKKNYKNYIEKRHPLIYNKIIFLLNMNEF